VLREKRGFEQVQPVEPACPANLVKTQTLQEVLCKLPLDPIFCAKK
jgi:hypothetical protein